LEKSGKMTSRVARRPIDLPEKVICRINEKVVTIQGQKGVMSEAVPSEVVVEMNDGQINVSALSTTTEPIKANALAGTIRALLQNHVIGVTQGFTKRLQLVGVGYRAQVTKTPEGLSRAELSLGFSHPTSYLAPEGITITGITPTELEISGHDKRLVGQVSAEIRRIRPPEPYKGKGIRYAGETIILKETKKK